MKRRPHPGHAGTGPAPHWPALMVSVPVRGWWPALMSADRSPLRRAAAAEADRQGAMSARGAFWFPLFTISSVSMVVLNKVSLLAPKPHP
jgi:hypothetical protein